MSISRRCSILNIAFAGALCGCPHPAVQAPPVEPTAAQEAQAEFALAPGDTFDVRVYGEQDMTGTYKVAPDGTIDFPLIGQVMVDNLLPHDVAQMLEKRLRDGYIRNPHVSILVKEQASKYVTILGMVSHPGKLQYAPRMKISDAIAGAGGFTPIAAKNDVTITREPFGEEGKADKVVIPVRAGDIQEGRASDVKLHPGDLISVPERIL